MSRPRILVCVDWFYPGYKAGGPIQSCRNFVAAMEDDFDIFVLSSDRDLGDSSPYSTIQTGQWNAYSKTAIVYYAAPGEINAGFLEKICTDVNPAFIYLNSMYSYSFTILPLWLVYRNKIKAKIVLAPRGMLQEGAMRFKPAKKKLFLQLIKAAGLSGKIQFHATDEQEQKDILQYFPRTNKPIVAPNFPAISEMSFEPVKKNAGELKLVYISRLAAKKNIHFLLGLLGKLPATIHCELAVRGEFEEEGYRLQCESIIKQLPGHVKVQFGGAINNDEIAGFLQQYHIFALPTLGENFGHAIFESFSAGRPVLISDKTPWRNLEAKKAGWDIALGEEAKFLQVLVAAAAMETGELNEWCTGAWQLAEEFRRNSNIKEQYEKLFY